VRQARQASGQPGLRWDGRESCFTSATTFMFHVSHLNQAKEKSTMYICIPVEEDRGLDSPVCAHFGS